MKNVSGQSRSNGHKYDHLIVATPTVCVKCISLVFTIKKKPVSV